MKKQKPSKTRIYKFCYGKIKLIGFNNVPGFSGLVVVSDHFGYVGGIGKHQARRLAKGILRMINEGEKKWKINA